ncbi:hypothetical protein AYO44_03425 [Planctomycetaceae bacterium SCGC AG-212-F19]|nr:hypothetical protein AYO44_03425 [Planctomycetaceae bacterium SCGC AG-212-F19]
MRKTTLGFAYLAWLVAVPVFAQPATPAQATPDVMVPANIAAGTGAPTSTMLVSAPAVEAPEAAESNRVWVAGDYMLRWLKPVCLTVPVVTIGNPANAIPGAIGQPGTGVVVGEHKFEFKGLSGARVTAGTWLATDPLVSFEASGFLLPRATARQEFVASNGSPASYLAFQTPTNTQDAIPFTIPGVVDGRSVATGSSQLWGVEANLTCGFAAPQRNVELRGTLLLGFRYLDLHDRVQVSHFLNPVGAPTSIAFGEDEFTTRNQFYGPQVGCKLGLNWGKCSLEYITKMAAGNTHQVSIVNGNPLIVGSAADPTLVPGPLLALPSNLGRLASNRPTLAPELALRFHWQVTDHLVLSLAYELLYWNKILCPGDQMDPHANITQLPGQGPVVGPLVPAPMLDHTDFFAQGLDAGLEVRY